MRSGLVSLLSRRLDGPARSLAFAAAAALVVLAGCLVALRGAGTAAERPSPRSADPAVRPLGDAALAPSIGRVRPAGGVARVNVAAAREVARRFLTGYLPYAYGRSTSRAFEAATTRAVKLRLTPRPRVPPRTRRLRARIVTLAVEATERSARAVAFVEDGERRYTVELELRRVAGRWLVSALR
jgi:hypothetical protein